MKLTFMVCLFIYTCVFTSMFRKQTFVTVVVDVCNPKAYPSIPRLFL